jgi:flagellar basal-body rod modification protein FlgD
MTTNTLGAFSGLNSDQYMQLMVEGMKNQDPLDPTKGQDFLGQLTQLTTLQALQELNASFGEILRLQQLTEGSDLIGKTVRFTQQGSTQEQTGRVASVSVEQGKVQLEIGSSRISLDQVTGVVA